MAMFCWISLIVRALWFGGLYTATGMGAGFTGGGGQWGRVEGDVGVRGVIERVIIGRGATTRGLKVVGTRTGRKAGAPVGDAA